MNTTHWLGGAALVLGALAAVAREPSPLSRGQIDVNALATMISREQDHVDAADLARWITERRSGLRIIDLRSVAEFQASHVPSAEHVSLDELGQIHFAPTDTIVLYSQGGTHAGQAWVLLRALGLQHVYFLSGGLDEWTSVATPTAPASDSGLPRWRRGC